MLNPESFLTGLEVLVPSYKDENYLLAISGGVDSMVLLHLFQKNKLDFQVAHVNYKLRGADSEADKQLIAAYCERHQLKFHLYDVSESDNQPDHSIQNWARTLRYHFFRQVQSAEHLKNLVTAHHLNDELETFIINLSRGSGLYGLSGIPANKNNIIRPFLKVPKEEIYAFAAEHQIDYREDESNKKSDYLRNKIRLEIVPHLVETNAHFLKNFLKSLEYLQQSRAFVQHQIAVIEEQILADDGPDKITYDKIHFEKQDDFVKFEILRKYGFEDPTEIEKIFSAKTGKSFYSKKYQILINRDELIITNLKEQNGAEEEITVLEKMETQGSTALDLRQIFSRQADGIERTYYAEAEISWKFDAEKIILPLKIRHRKTGDLFHPVEMFGRKKVSKFFKDEKLSLLDKGKVWLLVDGHDEVLGIIPLRQDRRFAETGKTIKILSIVF